jgi:hypothetical protein
LKTFALRLEARRPGIALQTSRPTSPPPDALPGGLASSPVQLPSVAKPARACLRRMPDTSSGHTAKHNTTKHIMKTILTLIAAASVAALSSSAFAAEKCANCAECCKDKTKTCTKDCCKDK